MDKQEALAKLKSQLRVLEGRDLGMGKGLALGVGSIDAALSEGGLPLGCIHEVHGDGADTTAAMGFVAGILALMGPGPIVWIAREASLYMPGLIPFGIYHDDLLFVRVRTAKDALWAMEETLRWQGLRAVVAELDSFDLTATRRLQLAAEVNGITGFLLAKREQGITAATTRWRISPSPSLDGSAEWNVTLTRCKGGRPAQDLVSWRSGRFQAGVDAGLSVKSAAS